MPKAAATGMFDAEWDRILTATAKWQHLMSLDWLVINHRRNESPLEGEESRIVAKTTADWEYRQASIWWYLPNVAGRSDEDIEATVVHELVHILTNPMETHVPPKHLKEVEYSVECICRALTSVAERSKPAPAPARPPKRSVRA